MRTGKGKWLWIAGLVVAAGLAGFYVGRPDLFRGLVTAMGGGAIPELAASNVAVGYVDLRRDSYASIDRAIDNFEKALALDPTYADAMAALTEAHLAWAEDLVEEADDLAARLSAAKEDEAAKLEQDIRLLRRRAERRRDEAFRYGGLALKHDPDGLAANRAMAEYYRITRAGEQMRELLARIETSGEKDAGVAYVRGSAAAVDPAAAGRAIRYLDAALERAPRMQRARYKLAQIYVQQGDDNAARIQLEAILDAVPDHERAKALLARLGAGAAEGAPAVEPKREASEDEDEDEDEEERGGRQRGSFDPEVAQARSFNRLFSRAERLRRADLSEKALEIYRKALAIMPDNAGALNGTGWCHLDLEQPTIAITYFNRARALIPDSAEAHMGLAEAYRQKGMKRDAIVYYRRYLEISPYGTEADVARQMLEQLQQK